MRSHWKAVVFGAAISVAGASHASLTTIQSPPSREANQAQILSHFYGGTFVASGNDFTNGSLTAVRLGKDATFDGGNFAVQTIAKFANRSEGFGFVPGSSGGAYHKLFEVAGADFSANGASDVDTGSGSFRWAMNGVSAVYTSNQANNPKNQDAAVTYQIDGTADHLTHYALFWENLNADEPAGVKTRNDFNDLVVDVTRKSSSVGGSGLASGMTGGSGPTNAAPLPAAVWPGGGMLLGLLIYRGRRKLRSALA